MPKPATSWSFAKSARLCKKQVADPAKVRELVDLFHEFNAKPDQSAVTYAQDPRRTVGDICLWKSISLAESNPVLAFRHFHLVLRYQALANYVYLCRAQELYATWKSGSSSPRPPVKTIGPIDLAEITMLGATAFALREDEMGHFFLRECVRILSHSTPYVEPNAILGGSVGPFLVRLYSVWQKISIEPRLRDALADADYGPFQAALDAWDDSKEMENALDALADLHAWKAVNSTLPTTDGVYSLSGWRSAFPAELFLILRVRRELEMPTSIPNHPMMQSPMCHLPSEDFASGYDEYLATALTSIRQAGMPNLMIPWECKFLAAGKADPRIIKHT